MKPVVFHGSSLKCLKDFPSGARREAGHQLDRLQHGLDPVNWKPVHTVAMGVREIRIHSSGQFRVIYLVRSADAVHVLHAFRKKSSKTGAPDIQQARRALKQLEEWQER